MSTRRRKPAVSELPECICPCGTCIDAIGYDPEIPCSDCPVHGQPEPEHTRLSTGETR